MAVLVFSTRVGTGLLDCVVCVVHYRGGVVPGTQVYGGHFTPAKEAAG